MNDSLTKMLPYTQKIGHSKGTPLAVVLTDFYHGERQ